MKKIIQKYNSSMRTPFFFSSQEENATILLNKSKVFFSETKSLQSNIFKLSGPKPENPKREKKRLCRSSHKAVRSKIKEKKKGNFDEYFGT